MIEKLQEQGDSQTGTLSFLWQGMNISLATTVDLEGSRFLRLRMGGVGAAVHITDSLTGNWTISIRAESSQGVGVLSQDAASICVGPALNATASVTDAIPDLEPSDE